MYRASNVLHALNEASIETKGYQFIKCPLDRCYINPANCRKAQTQTCAQEVTVLYQHDNHNKAVTLRFYFTISSTDYDGFIDEENEFLQLLIRRKVIKKDDIKRLKTNPDEPELFQ